MFKDMLKSGESVFKNHEALNFEFQPKVLLHRDKEQRYIIDCIRPLVAGRDGRNVFFWGQPGIGKTLAVRHILDAIDDPQDDQYGDVSDMIYPIYINCWNKNTTFKIVEDICDQVGYKFTQNKKTEELFKIVANIINKKTAVFVFDEVDKVQDFDFLYTILEQIFKKCIILITNHKDFILSIEDRIKSRLAPDMLEFKPYNEKETNDILEQRKGFAFHATVWEPEAFRMVVEKASQKQDIRAGLHLMKEAGENAEMASSKKILPEHVQKAFIKIDQISVRSDEELDEDAKFILKIVKEHSGERIGNLFKLYQDEKGESSYKTFQRKIQKLSDGKFVNVSKVTGGSEGSTTIVNYLRTTKKLTDF
jgi:cell division control protein 6